MTPLLLLAKLVGVRRLTRATVSIVKWTLLLMLVGGIAFYFWLTGDIDKAVIAVAALAVALGVRWWWRNRHVGIVKWAVRLLLLGLAGVALKNTGIGWVALNTTEGQMALAALAVALVFLWWWRRNRRVETSVGERFIDGKPVPDKLAVAALAVPPQSPAIYDVLRGLPDYAKTLLNLPLADFQYTSEDAQQGAASPVNRPKIAVKNPFRMMIKVFRLYLTGKPTVVKFRVTTAGEAQWLSVRMSPWTAIKLVLRRLTGKFARGWAVAAAGAALLLVVGVFGMMMWNTRQAAGEQQRQRELTDTQARRAEDILKNGPSSAAPETPPATPPRSLKDILNGPSSAAPETPSATPSETWRDPATGLLWPMKDNGSEVITFPVAKGHCDSLDVNGLKAWRLPTIKELDTVVDLSSGAAVFRGGIQLSQPIEALWSSTPFGKRAGMYTVLETWKELPKGSTVDDFTHVLCVHD